MKTIEQILEGIDKCEVDDDSGWWETDSGAAFGAQKKQEILAYIEKLMLPSSEKID